MDQLYNSIVIRELEKKVAMLAAHIDIAENMLLDEGGDLYDHFQERIKHYKGEDNANN